MRMKRQTIAIVIVAVALLLTGAAAMRDHGAEFHAHLASFFHGHR